MCLERALLYGIPIHYTLLYSRMCAGYLPIIHPIDNGTNYVCIRKRAIAYNNKRMYLYYIVLWAAGD